MPFALVVRTSAASFADALSAATAGSDVPLYFNVHTTAFPAGEIRGQWVASENGGDHGTGGPVSEAVDWEALAARVLAFHAATGSWGLLSEWLSDTPPDEAGVAPMDAIAAEDQENQGVAGDEWAF